MSCATRHRGSTFVIVLAGALFVMVVGFAAATVSRINTKAVVSANEAQEAEALALSAIEHALIEINARTVGGVALWRSDHNDGDPTPELAAGGGTLSYILKGIQGDLEDDALVRLYGIGRVNETVRVFSVLLGPQSGSGLDPLRAAVHADRDINISSNTTVQIAGGPVSSDGKVIVSGTLIGDVETDSLTNIGTFSGGARTDANPKPMPAERIVEDIYLPLATPIPWTGTELDAPLLSATVNPFGPTNHLGIYHVQVPNNEQLHINIDRIKGTLLVTIDGAISSTQIKVDNAIYWEPHNMSLPILIIRAAKDTKIKIRPPPGTVLQGGDTYPSELRGLVYIVGRNADEVVLSGTLVGGLVVTNAPVTLGFDPGTSPPLDANLFADRNLLHNPPLGFAAGAGVAPIPGSWRRAELPD